MRPAAAPAAVDADVAAVRRVWAALSALTEELADDPDAAEIVDAAAEYVVSAQVNERGIARLAELGSDPPLGNVSRPAARTRTPAV